MSYIKREAAISAILSFYPEAHYPDFYASVIEKLPSVDITSNITCSTCKYHEDNIAHYCSKLGRPCPDDSEFFCKYGTKR